MTALCLTRNRRIWLPKAIQCFQAQTYTSRELLIVADGEDVRDLLPGDNRIRLIHIEEGRLIGDKRNFGCELAAGQIIAHWDDDDYSAPGRLADQVTRLVESGKAVTGYHTMVFRDPSGSGYSYNGTPNFAMGTSLCYRRDWWEGHRFPALQVGEDNGFVQEAWTAQQLISVPAGDLMHATIHGGNTSPRQLTGSCWTKVA